MFIALGLLIFILLLVYLCWFCFPYVGIFISSDMFLGDLETVSRF